MELMGYSGAWGKLSHKKTCSPKSRGTVPLKEREIKVNKTDNKRTGYRIQDTGYKILVQRDTGERRVKEKR